MDCESFNNNLDSFEMLSEETKKAMYEHTTTCERCKQEMDFMRSVLKTVRTMPKIEPPDDFMERLNKRIDEEERRADAIPARISRNLRRNWRVYASAAACFALIAVLTSQRDVLISRFTDSDDVIQTETVVTDGNEASVADEIEKLEAVVDEGVPPAQETVQNANDMTQINPTPSQKTAETAAPAVSTATPTPQKYVIASAAAISTPVPASTEAPVTKARTVEDENEGIALTSLEEPEAHSVNARAVGDVERAYSIAEGKRSIANGRCYGVAPEKKSDKPIGKIKISSEDAEVAINLALKYSYGVEGNLYYTNAPNLTLMLSSFSNEGVEYANYTPGYDGDIAFCLVLV